jgi:hypothetical protein
VAAVITKERGWRNAEDAQSAWAFALGWCALRLRRTETSIVGL